MARRKKLDSEVVDGGVAPARTEPVIPLPPPADWDSLDADLRALLREYIGEYLTATADRKDAEKREQAVKDQITRLCKVESALAGGVSVPHPDGIALRYNLSFQGTAGQVDLDVLREMLLIQGLDADTVGLMFEEARKAGSTPSLRIREGKLAE